MLRKFVQENPRFPSPRGEVSLSSELGKALKVGRPKRFHPLAGKWACQAMYKGRGATNQNVSIPSRGSGLVKAFLGQILNLTIKVSIPSRGSGLVKFC